MAQGNELKFPYSELKSFPVSFWQWVDCIDMQVFRDFSPTKTCVLPVDDYISEDTASLKVKTRDNDILYIPDCNWFGVFGFLFYGRINLHGLIIVKIMHVRVQYAGWFNP